MKLISALKYETNVTHVKKSFQNNFNMQLV